VQPPKKPLVPEMGPASKLGHVPHPPSTCGSSVLQGQRRNKRHPQPFGHFLDFLTESQVLDSLETVVEEATERMAAMKTEAGVPLVEVQDPVEVPSGRRRARARPSLSTVHRHRAQPSLCTGHPNNYPSSSSSTSDSHGSLMAGWLGPHVRDSDLGAQGLGSLPPVRDKLLLEKNLKRLLQLERKGKGFNQSCTQRNSLLWDSLGSQTSCQWTQEQSPSWFSGLLGSSSGMPEASELRPGEREWIFHKQEFNKELKSLLSQLESLDLPGYCPLREPHRMLNFLAEHHLFPALQSVVSQAVDKLRGACCCDGRPLFPTSLEPTSDNLQPPGSEPTNPTNTGQPHASPHPTASSPKMPHRKHKDRGGYPSMSSAQVATRFKLKVTPTEKPNVPSSSLYSRKEVPDSDPKLQNPPVSLSSSQRAKPWRGLHLTLPAPGIVVEVDCSQGHLRGPVTPPSAFPCPHSSCYFLPKLFSVALSPVTSSKVGPGMSLQEKDSLAHLS
uniref:Coiled-coil domain containing 116 n=1 Tax=Cebus imitator TaxID=2715852 RepID=A0A2K5QTA5_CEBIM